jgi:hypothetical protein
MMEKKLPEIPKGWEILPEDGYVEANDQWSYYSKLDIHRWLPCKGIGERRHSYNVYIRKIDAGE